MRRQHVLTLVVIMMVSLLGGLVASSLTADAATTQATLTVVASELDNPRGLAFGPEAALYVAEAGRGGDSNLCIEAPEGGEQCYGPSGAITRIAGASQERIITGLPSLAGEDGNFATGPHDIAWLRNGIGYVVIGLGADPAARSELGLAGSDFGQLVRITTSGQRVNDFDLATYEETADPDGLGPDSNPYAVLALGDRRIAVDAGGNDMIELSAGGSVVQVTTFPTRTVAAPPGIPGLPPQINMQPVPDSVAIGPDGAYYVGELTGFPFPVDGARVYRVVPGLEPEVYAEGFTNIIDLAFDDQGTLYVLEIFENGFLQVQQPGGDLTGALIRVASDKTQTPIISEGLVAPSGLALSPEGGIYISNSGVFSGTGEVVRVDQCDPADTECSEPAALPAPLVTTATGAQEVDAEGNPNQGDPDGRASVIITLNASAGEVCIQTNVFNIEQPTLAHIHAAPAGQNGGIVVNFTPLIDDDIISGCVEADPALIEQIGENPSNYYVNIHNADFPNGAIRGQLAFGDEGSFAFYFPLIAK